MLTPTHVDTNSLFITERLNEIGIEPSGEGVAGDDRGVLKATSRMRWAGATCSF